MVAEGEYSRATEDGGPCHSASQPASVAADGGQVVRALFVSSVRSWLWGGGEKWLVVLGSALRERGHEITVVARPGSRLLAAAEQQGIPAVGVAFGGDLHPIPLLALRRLLQRTRAQVVVASLDKDARIAGLAARSLFSRVRVLCRKGLPIMVDNWRYRFTYSHLVDGILTPAQSIRRRLREFPWLKIEIEVVPNGVDLDRFPFQPERLALTIPGLPPLGQGPLVLELARLAGQKGHGILLEAVSQLGARFVDARLLLIGDGPERGAIEQEIARRGLGKSVLLAGHRDDSAAVLAASDIVVLPSLDEGYPNVLLEAMATGRAVVASDVGDAARIVQDGVTGFLVPPGRSGPLAERLAILLADPELRSRMGAAGRRRAEREFSAEGMIATTEAYLRRQAAPR